MVEAQHGWQAENRIELIVLVGAPGSGKTAIGNELASRYGYRYRDFEAELVEIYGPLETFVQHKNKAILDVHRVIVNTIAESGPVVVIETTALSEQDFIDDLIRTHRSLTVRLDVSLPNALERIQNRVKGRNLSNGIGTNQWIWERFYEVHEKREFDLRIDMNRESVSVAARSINKAISGED